MTSSMTRRDSCSTTTSREHVVWTRTPRCTRVIGRTHPWRQKMLFLEEESTCLRTGLVSSHHPRPLPGRSSSETNRGPRRTTQISSCSPLRTKGRYPHGNRVVVQLNLGLRPLRGSSIDDQVPLGHSGGRRVARRLRAEANHRLRNGNALAWFHSDLVPVVIYDPRVGRNCPHEATSGMR